MKNLPKMGIGAVLLGAIGAACSAEPPADTAGAGATGAGGTSGSQSGATQSTGGDEDFTSGTGVTPSAGAGTGTSGGESCAGTTSQAEQIPLDIYLMLDSSGSMYDKTGAGPSKWDAVTQALSAFFSDPQSSGLGVGLQHFPLLGTGGVPKSCTANSQCGSNNGPCFLKACNNTPLLPCDSNASCSGGGSCVAIGRCGNLICKSPGAQTCSNGLPCVAIKDSFCLGPVSCTKGEYGAPLAEIAPVTTAAGALNAAIGKITPAGGTPTSAALQGAIDHAKAWAGANPTHAVTVLLATDGQPTQCDTSIKSIEQIAAQGVSGNPSIKTFVIGVLAASDTAGKANMDAIAIKGGTNKAFIVDPNQNAEQAFLDALNAIRGTKLACEFALPAATGGDIDLGKVNVEYTPPGATMATTIGYATNLAGCDPTDGGWYYDIDPAAGTPTKLLMCPATCTRFSADAGAGAKVDIRIGCKTVTIPPPR